MAIHDPIADQLAPLYEHSRRPRRQQQIQQRWARFPSLAGRTVDDVAVVLADAEHRDHNRVGADLLRACRQGDIDATTIVLTAVRPLVFGLSRGRPHGDRAHVWAAVGKVIATTSPDVVATSIKPFMLTLIGRVRRDAVRYRAFDTNGFVRVGHTDTHVRDHLDEINNSTDTTERAALAAIALEQIGAYLVGCGHGPDRWQELLGYTFDPPTAAIGVNARNRVMRLRRRLESCLSTSTLPVRGQKSES